MNSKPILLTAVALLAASLATATEYGEVTCERSYPLHLQGVCTDERESIFWCFTTKLVKTDRSGKVLTEVDVARHHGDLCFHKTKIYVAVNLGKFNEREGGGGSWVYLYRAGDLALLAKHKTPEVIHGAGGIAYHDGRFLVVGGLPKGLNENYAYEYDGDFKFVRKHVLASGYTNLGIQTAAFADGSWWFGCYGSPGVLLKADASLQKVARFEFNCSTGIVPVGRGKFLVARGTFSEEKGYGARLVMAETDAERGLTLTKKASPKK